jgi:hypothetical protein
MSGKYGTNNPNTNQRDAGGKKATGINQPVSSRANDSNAGHLSAGNALHLKQDVPGPMNIHRLAALGQDVDGMTDPYGEGFSAADKKPSTQNRW